MEEQREAAAAEGSTTGEQRKARRWLALGGAGVAAALLATLALKTRADAPPGGEATRAPEAVAAAEGAPAATANANARPVVAAGDAVTANVPLFGPTPLSTIEAVAVPPGAPVPSSFAAAPGAGAAVGRVDAGGGEGAGASSFGKGDVRRPRTVRLQMDAPIGALRGNVSDGNLVVTVPGRHNIEPAGPLARRDPRLASVKAVPVGDDTEVTLSFKGGDVPPFLAKASGRTLEIDLGQGRGASASASDDDGEPRSKKRRARRAHESSSGRHGAKADRDARHEGGDKRHAEAGKKDDKRHADAGGKDEKRHADGKDEKRHADKGERRAEAGKDEKRPSEAGKDDKRHADAGGKDDKRHVSDAKSERRHESADKGDKRRSERPKRERDRDDESGDD